MRIRVVPFQAEVLEATQHPNADKLRLCTVNNGSATFQVVCGAPNARTGMRGVFASEGMYIPGIDVTLKKATIRGVPVRVPSLDDLIAMKEAAGRAKDLDDLRYLRKLREQKGE